MFDIGWSELLIVAAVAILVVGPKDLPGLLRVIGQYFGKVKRIADDFKGQVDDAIRETELSDLKDNVQKEVDSLKEMNPINDLEKSVNEIDQDEKARIQAEKEALEADENLEWDEPDEIVETNAEGEVVHREVKADADQDADRAGAVHDDDDGDLLDEEEYDDDAATSKEMIKKSKEDFERRVREESHVSEENQANGKADKAEEIEETKASFELSGDDHAQPRKETRANGQIAS